MALGEQPENQGVDLQGIEARVHRPLLDGRNREPHGGEVLSVVRQADRVRISMQAGNARDVADRARESAFVHETEIRDW